MTADVHLDALSDDQRQRLESWLIDFDLTWDEHRLAYWLRQLPPPGDSLRRTALVEMVKIDLERRWQRGQRVNLETYVKALPELATPAGVPADLLLAEHEARKLCGAPADLADLARRFPGQADELARLAVAAKTPPAASLSGAHPPAGGPSLPPDWPTPLPAGSATSTAPLPEQLGRYRILRTLGQGAMGTVYLAHDTQLDRQVALKVPRFTAADGPEVRQRFLTEARAAATIEHPHVCPVYDVGEIDGTPYLTMAYLQGQSLGQLLQARGPLSARQAAALVRQLALALQTAHERGIIHRDLKPSNVMIKARGEPVLLDFGLARRLRQGDIRLTHSGQPLGSPAYMSPEQVAGAVAVMGPGCDIYSLGVILYQMLTGRLPFDGPLAEVLGQIVTQQPVPPSKYRPALDPRLDAVCLKALSKEVAGRYATMRDFAAALGSWLRESRSPTTAPPAPLAAAPLPALARDVRPAVAWLRWKPLWLALAAGVAAAVVLAGGLLWSARSTATVQIELDGPPAQVEVRVDGERIDSAGLTEPLQLSPGRHHLLVTGSKIETVSESFTIVRGDNPALRVKLVPSAAACADPLPPHVDRASTSRSPGARHDDDGPRERERRTKGTRPRREAEEDDD
jgi:tRNA A-37 threonylcarbamoyl transferase component Bud32